MGPQTGPPPPYDNAREFDPGQLRVPLSRKRAGAWMLKRLIGTREAHSQVGRRARASLGALAIAVMGAGIGVVAGPISADASSIFQIEFRHCDTLHIGYKNFPVGTILHWSVNQHGRDVATGQFVTAPGPGMHFDSAKLPAPLDRHPKPSVTFVATIDGREFRMTAGRAPPTRTSPSV